MITYSGLKELEDVDQMMVKKLCDEHYPKVQRVLKTDINVKVLIKTKAKEGHRHRYEVTLNVKAPGAALEAHTEEWDLATAIHRGFDDLEQEARHRFRE